MRRSTLSVCGRIRLTTMPSWATTQIPAAVLRIAPGQIAPLSRWIVAIVRPVVGDTLDTVASSWFATQTEPWPIAIPVGRPPTGIRSVIRFVSGSIRSNSSKKTSIAQIEPKPAASAIPPGRILATTLLVAGSMRAIPSTPSETQSVPAAMTMLEGRRRARSRRPLGARSRLPAAQGQAHRPSRPRSQQARPRR